MNADQPSTGDFDPFVANAQYPEADQLFCAPVARLRHVKDTCLYVLDTNSLLVPYQAGPEILDELLRTYTALIRENRLLIPGQVAREFARHRGVKIADLHKQLADHKSRSDLLPLRHPLLQALPEYRQALDLATQAASVLSQYRQKLDALIAETKAWYWDDPVSLFYRTLFLPSIVFDPQFDKTTLLNDLRYRFKHRIPPGFRDASKPDDGIGDLLIWKTILRAAEEKKLPCVFVSSDEKSDWFVRSNNEPLFPRYELVDEYRRASGGHSFHIIRFSALLNLYGAQPELVKQVSSQEHFSQTAPDSSVICAQHWNDIHAWLRSYYPNSTVNLSPDTDIEHLDFMVQGADAVLTGVRVLRSRPPLGSLRRWYRHASRLLKPNGPYDRLHAVVLLDDPIYRRVVGALDAFAARSSLEVTLFFMSAADNIVRIEPLRGNLTSMS